MPVSIGSQVTEATIVGTDFYVLEETDTIFSSTNGIKVEDTAPSTKLLVLGDVFADSNGIEINAANTDVVVGADAYVASIGDGVEFLTAADGSSFVNYGTIISYNGRGVDASFAVNNGFGFQNYGIIQGYSYGAYLGLELGTGTNHGTISGAVGVYIDDNNAEFINYGTIISDLPSGTGGYGGLLAGVYSNAFSASFELTNYGSIIADGDAIVALAAIEVSNYGQISGDVLLSGGSDTFVNFGDGHVDGDVFGGLGDDTMAGGSEVDEFFGDEGEDEILGRGGIDFLDGGDDADLIFGGAGEDTISGGTGSDLIRGGEGDDSMDGGTFGDLMFGNAGEDFMLGDVGNDEMFGGNDDDTVVGEEGKDILYGGRGDDIVDGGDDEDVLYGGRDADVLSGGTNADTVYGGGGDDMLFGDGGDDVLMGGGGNDMLTGSFGSDTFVFGRHAGNDTITDFEDNLDQIDLSAFGFASVAAAKVAAENVDGGTLFDLALVGGSGTIFVEDISKGSLTAADFIL